MCLSHGLSEATFALRYFIVIKISSFKKDNVKKEKIIIVKGAYDKCIAKFNGNSTEYECSVRLV